MGSNEKTPEMSIEERLRANRRAYKQLSEGSDTLLRGSLFFTEKALLRLVRALYSRRLEQLGSVWSDPEEPGETAV